MANYLKQHYPKKLKQRTVACMQPPQAKLQKNIDYSLYPGCVDFKKNIYIYERKKTLAKGKGLKILLNLSLSKEI